MSGRKLDRSIVRLWGVVREDWAFIVKYYKSEEYLGTFQAMCASRLATSEWADRWFPSTSHGCLVLSPTPDFNRRNEFPCICVFGEEGEARIEVWGAYGDSNSLSRFRLTQEVGLERLCSFLESYKKSREHK